MRGGQSFIMPSGLNSLVIRKEDQEKNYTNNILKDINLFNLGLSRECSFKMATLM
jgi:hypothetical protein